MSNSLTCLASRAKSFVSISHDNRVHLWSTDSRKEKRPFVEKNHLSHSYNCMSWQQSDKNPLGDLAIGCSDSTVVVWDLSRGVVSKVIKGDPMVASDVALAADLQSLYVCSPAYNQINHYSLESGELIKSIKTGKKGVSKLCINPRVDVMAIGSSSVKLMDLSTGRRRKLAASFPGGVQSMTFTQCGCYLACCGADSREIVIFDVQASAQSAAPLAVVAVSGLPIALHARRLDDQTIECLVCYESEGGCIIRLKIEAANESGLDINTCMTSIGTTSQILGGCFGSFGGNIEGDGVSLVLGPAGQPFFTHICYTEEGVGPGDSLLKHVAVKSPERETELHQPKQQQQQLPAPIVLGPNEYDGLKRPLVSHDEVGSNSLEDGTVNSKKLRTETNESKRRLEEELTLQERLESISHHLDSLKEKTTKSTSANGSTLTPTSDSLVVLIDQSLQSGDDSLLEQCLGCEDVSVVDATAKSMPTARVVELLKRLVSKFEKRPGRGVLLTHWLSALLKHHTSFLISVPNLSRQLAGLGQILEHRLATYSKLAALGGRLDLLMQQISSGGSESDAASASILSLEPMQVYRED